VIFGGININLEQAKLAPGKIPLTLLAIFGGFDIIVPEEWNVEVRGIPIFAGMKVTRPLRPFHLLRESEVHM
jgi:predicted membrane protein